MEPGRETKERKGLCRCVCVHAQSRLATRTSSEAMLCVSLLCEREERRDKACFFPLILYSRPASRLHAFTGGGMDVAKEDKKRLPTIMLLIEAPD